MLFIVYLLSIFFFFFFFFSSRRRHTRCSRDWSSDVCSSDLLFPPGAYHSEGHQDSMGVCRYLALMKRLFEGRFTLALLDDVVMSVDSGHRYQFCKLLKTHFPHTQFIITTHDRLCAEQLRSAGLVT